MYPFKAILAGAIEPVSVRLKNELALRGVDVEAEMSTAGAVIDRYAEEPVPRLLIIHDTTAEIPRLIRLLRYRFPSWPILALVEMKGDSVAILTANRAGADQVVDLPLNATDFNEALDRLAGRFHPIDRPSLVLAVTSAVPGAGTSTIATALAGELSSGYATRTVLLEGTLRMGVLGMNLNVQPTINLNDLLADVDKLDINLFRKALMPISLRLDLLAASPDLPRPVPDPVHGLLKVIEVARQAAEIVVVDLPGNFDDVYIEAALSADHMVVVGNQSLPAIRTMRMILDVAAASNPVRNVHFVLNKYHPEIQGLTATKIAETLGMPKLFVVPNDFAGVMRAAIEGRQLRDLFPGSPVLVAVRTLARAIMGERLPQASDDRSFLSRLYKLFHPRIHKFSLHQE